MKKLIFILALASCTKDVEFENNTAARPLAPQNPLPPQVVVSNPVPYQRVADTFHLKFSATAGRTWWGGPDNLSRCRVSYDGKYIYDISFNKKSYSDSLVITTGIVGKHSIGVSFFSGGGYTGTQGLYVNKF